MPVTQPPCSEICCWYFICQKRTQYRKLILALGCTYLALGEGMSLINGGNAVNNSLFENTAAVNKQSVGN